MFLLALSLVAQSPRHCCQEKCLHKCANTLALTPFSPPLRRLHGAGCFRVSHQDICQHFVFSGFCVGTLLLGPKRRLLVGESTGSLLSSFLIPSTVCFLVRSFQHRTPLLHAAGDPTALLISSSESSCFLLFYVPYTQKPEVAPNGHSQSDSSGHSSGS